MEVQGHASSEGSDSLRLDKPSGALSISTAGKSASDSVASRAAGSPPDADLHERFIRSTYPLVKRRRGSRAQSRPGPAPQRIATPSHF